MWPALIAVCVVVLCLCARAGAAGGFNPEFERDSLSLSGQWQRHSEHGDEEVWREEVASKLTGWKPVTVPGNLLPDVHRKLYKGIHSVWVVRTFRLTRDQARRGAALKWNLIRFGPSVWINGRFLAHHPTIGPHTVMVPPGMLRSGTNRIVLKVQGWGGIPRGEAGKPLIPTGSGTQSWGAKAPAIENDIWLDFYDRAYIKWALAMPNIKAGTVTFRVYLDAAEDLPEEIVLAARVRAEGAKTPTGRVSAPAATSKPYTDITVPIPNPKLWSPAERNLYVAEIDARSGSGLCDRVRFRFGMRQVKVSRGHFTLNGKPLWLRGSNLVGEWRWGDQFNRGVKAYLVDEARIMSLNSFRTHTLPPPKLWADTGDEHGIMFLAELPVLYNNRDFKFTPAERKIFHKHALLDATGWVTKLWNHPSVILWVLSNESLHDNKWEKGPYWQYVHDLDPTRLSLRSGGAEGTPDVYDIHTTDNYNSATEGRVIQTLQRKAAHKDPTRPLSNSEYMNTFGKSRVQVARWLGRPDHPDAALNFAEFGAEHTEVMRRLRYDGILPYMYAPWTGFRGRRWRRDFPSPMAAALHSAMSPVLASLDLFDRNFPAASEVTTPLALINETGRDVPAKIDVYVTPEHPLFVPEPKALAAAVYHDSFDVTLKAHSLTTRRLRWPVPRAEGSYFLAVVLRREGARPVVSQRVVRAIDSDVTAAGLNGKPVVVLGAGPAGRKWLKQRGIPFRASIGKGKLDAHVVVVWNADKIAPAVRKAATAKIRRYVKAGGRLVILRHDKWDWTSLVDATMEPGPKSASRAFAYSRARHPMLTGIDPEFLKRWNGLPGTVADRVLAGDLLTAGKKLLWINSPPRPVAVSVPMEAGEVVLCTLDLAGHLGGADGTYDPVAERILLNLLQR